MKVNPESPFEGDALSRKQSCEDLADFIAEAETPYVLAVDAPWGAGKTVFARMLQSVCIGRDLPTVFFNAWEADFHNDALAAMIGEVSGELKSGDALVDAVRKTGKALLSRHMAMTALKTVASAAGAGALAEGVDKALEKFDVAEEYRKRRDALKEFQKALSAYAAKHGGRLVFFVDELDRCRPVFAVEVLEKIKHIFAAEGVFFVVSVNKEQLGKTIKSVYGGIDADVYLRRFFDRNYPLVNRGGFITSVLENLGFVKHIERRNALRQTGGAYVRLLDPQEEIPRVAALCDAYGFSLRDCEQVAHTVAHAMMNYGFKSLIFSDVIAFFAAMSVADPQRFAKCRAISSDSGEGGHTFSRFPYAEWAGYYQEVTGLNIEKDDDEVTREHYLLQYTYAWLCANRYLSDDAYRSQVNTIADERATPDHRFMSRVRQMAQKAQSEAFYNGGVSPHPKSVIEAVARFGKRQFEDGD